MTDDKKIKSGVIEELGTAHRKEEDNMTNKTKLSFLIESQ